MKVTAIATGYYNNDLRRAGDVFDVPDGLQASWFVPVEDDKQPDHKPKGRKEDDRQPA